MTLHHRGMQGTVERDPGGALHGRVLGVDEVVGYLGLTLDELREDFVAAVDDYLDRTPPSPTPPPAG